MKKSPWKFLVGLATRRSEAKVEESASASNPDSEVSAPNETGSAAVRHGSTAPSAVHGEDPPASAVAAVNAPDRDVEDADDVGGGALAPSKDSEQHASAFARQDVPSRSADVEAKDTPVEASAASPPVRRTRGPGRRKSAGVQGSESAAEVHSGSASAEPTVLAERPLLEQMASLDEEVQQLRQHLAAKLRMQNKQLEKMLERFNRSS